MITNTSTSGKQKVFAAAFALAALGVLGVLAVKTVAAQEPAKLETPQVDATKLVGQPAPGFTLPDQNDKPIKLSSNKGKWVILAFYPADMTTGCTFQNRSYSEHVGDFAPKNAVVYTVSTQDTTSKKAFCSKDNLKHTLLSDVGGKVAKQYGVLMPAAPIANRWTYYIAPNGKIAYVDKSINVGKAAEDSLAILDKLEKESK